MPPCAFEERNSQYLRTSGNLTAKKQALWVRTECHCHHLLLTIPSRLGFSPRLKGIRGPQMSDRVAMGFLMTPETNILPLLARYLDKQMGKLYTGSLGSKLHVKVKTSFQMDTSTGEQTLVMSFLPADGYSAKAIPYFPQGPKCPLLSLVMGVENKAAPSQHWWASLPSFPGIYTTSNLCPPPTFNPPSFPDTVRWTHKTQIHKEFKIP